MKAKFTALERKEGIAELIFQSTLCQNLKKKSDRNIQSAIVECLVPNKGMILTGKLSICENNTLMPKSSKKSEAESISNVKGCAGYWNEQCAEMSSHLWLPTETVLQDLGQTSSSSFSTKMARSSWFSMKFHFPPKKNLQGTCSQFYTYFHAGFTASESTSMKSRKIRIYPTKEQRQLLRQWLGTSRYIYNKTIEYLKHPETQANWITIKKWLLKTLPEWAAEVPFQIKSIAVKDACQTVKLCKTKYRKTKQYCEAKFRSKRDKKQTIYIPKSALKPEHGVYYTILGDLKTYEKFPEPEGDCRLTYQNGRWFVNVPTEVMTKPESQGRIVSVDPGVRTFMTFYSPESCGKLGSGDFSRIQRLCYWLDKLISRMSKAERRQRYKMRKAADRMRWKIRDLIEELHHKAALFLVKNFDVIIIPKFETSQMSNRKTRKIKSKPVRSMLTFAHFKFQEFLKSKAIEYGKQVIHQDEAYTSKTCSWNGVMKNIGGAKLIRDGEIVMDRDYNGARGIFLRALRDSAFSW